MGLLSNFPVCLDRKLIMLPDLYSIKDEFPVSNVNLSNICVLFTVISLYTVINPANVHAT